jgi:large subunit ribosomal protein L28
VRVKVLARVLRTIDKVGGLDEYLLGESAARVKELGMGGWALRWRVMRTEWYRMRRVEERRRLGLPEKGWVGEGKGTEGEVEEGLSAKEIDQVLDKVDREAEKGGDVAVELGELGFMEEKMGRERAVV